MAWQMPANQPSQATFLQWIKEVIKQACEGSEGLHRGRDRRDLAGHCEEGTVPALPSGRSYAGMGKWVRGSSGCRASLGPSGGLG